MATLESRHAYRFKYLKSDHWQNLRLEKLVSVKARCECCGYEHFSNDVHHLNYRNLYDVTLDDLMVLCRGCHERTHIIMSKLKETGIPHGGHASERFMRGWVDWNNGRSKTNSPLCVLLYVLLMAGELRSPESLIKTMFGGFKAYNARLARIKAARRDIDKWMLSVLTPQRILRIDYGRDVYLSAKLQYRWTFPHFASPQ